MSYSDILDNVFGKRPIWIYRFVKGGEERFFTSRSTDWRDTDADFFDQIDVFNSTDFFSNVYISTALFQSSIKNTSAIGRAETTFTFPQTDEWAQSYIEDNGYDDNQVFVYRLFLNDGALEKQLKFRGRVISASSALTRIVLTAENRFTELRRKGISAVVQRPCRHALYHSKGGYGCGLNIADFEAAGTLTALSGNTATVAAAASQADGYYSGGVFSWQGKRQFIISHSGSTLTLLGAVPGLAAAQASGNQPVSIAPGCDLTRATCNSKFNNLANFGGFPWADETPYDGKTLF
jgi:uncharacterized phage protein (TIGR02218 family)